jgi:hypothetical protein
LNFFVSFFVSRQRKKMEDESERHAELFSAAPEREKNQARQEILK